ncbi:MAG: type II toxin-antitoxin system antitoxin SocA domain-containing protein [Alphaproteobacteria bacterium]
MNPKTYSAVAIANFFVRKGLDEGRPVTPMKVQKLVYIAHGFTLALTDGNTPLIQEEVGAWPFGPVVASVYKKFLDFDKNNITSLAKDVSGQDILVDEADLDTNAILNRIWEVYGKFGAVQLSNLTHQEDSPWFQTYQEGTSRVISQELITKYYKKALSNG